MEPAPAPDVLMLYILHVVPFMSVLTSFVVGVLLGRLVR